MIKKLMEPPAIDSRDYKALVKQISDLLVEYYCKDEWNHDSLLKDKQAFTLIHIFSRMMEITIQRLNRVPDKNLLTFLDLIGLQLFPPRIARAPLTFTMAEGESRYEKVPAGIQAATVQTKEKEAAVFETEKDLTIILPKLAGTVSLNPDNDKWTDHTPVLIDEKEEGIEDLFKGQNAIPHRLYLGHKRLFSLEESTTILLKIELKEEITPTVRWEVKWYYHKDDSQDKIPLHVTNSADPVVNLLNSETITFNDVSGISEKTLKGIEKITNSQKSWTNHWIFAELITPIPTDELPEIDTIKAGIKTSPDSTAGTGTISSEEVNITGDSTFFTKELKTGDSITAKSQTRIVDTIDSDTSLSVDTAFDPVLPEGTAFSYLSIGTGTISTDKENKEKVTSNSTIFEQELDKGYYIRAAGQTRTVTEIISETLLTVDSPFDPEIHGGKKFTCSPSVGTGTISSTNKEVTGIGTAFTEELITGDSINAKGQTRIVDTIDSDTSLSVDTAFDPVLPEGTAFSYLSIGTGTISTDKEKVTSDSTIFKQELDIDYSIRAAGQTRTVTEIISETLLTVDSPFDPEIHGGKKFTYSSAGTGTISSTNEEVTGIGTAFTEELKIGDSITANDQTKKITQIISNTKLIVDSAFNPDLTNGTNFRYSRTGTGTISSMNREVKGETAFKEELKIGYSITADGQIRTIIDIISDTELTVDSAFNPELRTETNFTYSKTGTGTISSKYKNVKGETAFTEELKIGDSIRADGQIRTINDIISDTELTVDTAFDTELTTETNFFFTPSPPIGFAFYNNSLLDLTRDFFPFGKEPKFNDTFHIGSKEVFSKNGAKVTLLVALTDGIVVSSQNIRLRWEFWDGKSWAKLGETTQVDVKEDNPQGNYLFTDSTEDFNRSGQVTFTCPKIEPTEINGEENYWIRVRIIGGNYGEEAKYEEQTTPVTGTGTISSESKIVTGTKTEFLKELNIGDFIIAADQTRKVIEINSKEKLTIEKPFEDDLNDEGVNFSYFKMWVYHPPTFKPPSIRTLALTYKFETPMENLEVVLEYNDFLYQKQTETCKNENKYFKPFKPVTDTQQSLYLAFDQDISTLPVTLFFPLSEMFLTAVQILEFETSGPEAGATSVKLTNVTNLKNRDIIEFRNQRGETEQRSITSINVDTNTINWETGLTNDFSATGSTASLFPPPVLAWEYWDGNMWTLLQSVEDETENITKRGFVQFLAPDDLIKRHCFEFDIEQYWIRIRLINGAYETFPKLKGLYTNTVWAHNLVSIQEEILGSSIGKPDQVFNFSQFPVIGISELQVIEVSITEEDRKDIISEEGEDAIKEFKEGNIVKYWVRWHEVKHFFSSKSNSRHYAIDHNNGKVIFGNGEMGMIPPIGKDNIKCSYQFGGGLNGNVDAEQITILRTALPFVEAVTNPEAADGGGEKEDMDRAKKRGPQTLKHRDRAVTYEDFVWLVMAEFPKIAKVKCLPATDPSIQHNPGWVTLIVVPDTEESKPIPTQQLISEIKSFLFERSSTYLTIRPQINLISPGYIKVWVETKVQYTSITEAKTIESRIIENLNEFFHPLRGGPEKSGWEFGRNVYISEVHEVIENTTGVDYVDQLYLYASIQMYKLTLDKKNDEIIKTQVSYPKHSKVTITGEKITYLLADRVERDKEMDRLTIMGFKEGDIIILGLSDGSGSVELKVKSVSHEIFGDILECETFLLDSGFPVGSIVMTYEGVESYILNDVPAGDVSLNPLKVAIIEKEDEAVLYLRDDPSIKKSFTINEVSEKVRTIFIEENYLIYSGIHTIFSGADDINEKK